MNYKIYICLILAKKHKSLDSIQSGIIFVVSNDCRTTLTQTCCNCYQACLTRSVPRWMPDTFRLVPHVSYAQIITIMTDVDVAFTRTLSDVRLRTEGMVILKRIYVYLESNSRNYYIHSERFKIIIRTLLPSGKKIHYPFEI